MCIYWGTTFYLPNWEEEASSGRNLQNRHEMYRNPLRTDSNVICLTLWTVPAADIAIKMQKTTWGHRILYIKQKREMLIWTLKPINARQYSQILPLPILFGSCCQTQSSPNSQLVGWKSRLVASLRKLHLQWWGRQRAGTLWTQWRSSSAGRRPGSPCTPEQDCHLLTFLQFTTCIALNIRSDKIDETRKDPPSVKAIFLKNKLWSLLTFGWAFQLKKRCWMTACPIVPVFK